MYMFIGTLPSAAAVLYDEHQLLWVQPGTIVAFTYIACIIPVPSEWIWLIENVQDPNFTFTTFPFYSHNFINQLISFTTATASATMIVFDNASSW